MGSIIGMSDQFISAAQNVTFNNKTSAAYEPSITSNDTSSLETSSDTNTIGINETTLRELEGQTIPNQYIVVLKEDEITNTTTGLESVLQSLLATVENLGLDVPYAYRDAIKGFVIKAPNNQTLTEALNIIRTNPHVQLIVQDQYATIRSQRVPTGINRVDGDQSSTISGDGQRVVNADIAIIDSGIDLDHSDLNVYRNINFLSPSNPGDDDYGHGTNVAGIAAAKDDQEGVVGIAPGARLWAVKVCDKLGGCQLSALLAGIDYVTQHKDEIDVVNVSVGCRIGSDIGCTEDYKKTVNMAFSNSAEKGVIYTVAAGNDGADAKDEVPANDPDVIAVSAIQDFDGKCGGSARTIPAGQDDTLARFSNFGPDVDVAAPGLQIYTTRLNNSYFFYDGTSMAAPHIAGAIALYKENHPTSSLFEIRNMLSNTGSKPDTGCDSNGHGYFTKDRDNIPEPLLYVKSINSFNILISTFTPRFGGDELYVQGHYKCEPPIITFDGFLEGKYDSSQSEFDRSLSNIVVSASRDINNNNTVIRIIADDGKSGAILKFQGSIDCSKPADISAIRGQNCMWVSDMPQETCNPPRRFFSPHGSLTLH